jgi:hypothetical protein
LSTTSGNNGLAEEVQNAVRAFYFRSDISYTMPGLKDEMTVWTNGKKERLRNHYLTMFLQKHFQCFKKYTMQLVLAFRHFVAFDLPMYFLLKNNTERPMQV